MEGYSDLEPGEDSCSACPDSLKSFGRDYRMYLEDDVDTVGWLLISDEQKLANFSRLERFWVGLYTLTGAAFDRVLQAAFATCDTHDID